MRAGLPWFSLFDEGMPAQKGSSILAKLKFIAKIDKKLSTKPLQDDTSVSTNNVVKLANPNAVRDGDW